MPLINKNNINEYSAFIPEPVVLDWESNDPDLTWWAYTSAGPEYYLDKPSNDNKPHKKYEYSTPIWYNEQKGGKKRKNRRF